MRSHEINNLDNFVGGWYIDTSLCDILVDQYKFLKDNGYEQEPKTEWEGYHQILFGEIAFEVQEEYRKCLSDVLEKYKEKYLYCHDGQSFFDGRLNPNFQRYEPNKFYSVLHYENAGSPGDFTRHLTYMTYLNDIKEGGETEFFYQKIKIKPEKGLTLIWPAQWTHTHRGHPAPEEKFITTGWYCYDIYRWRK